MDRGKEDRWFNLDLQREETQVGCSEIINRRIITKGKKEQKTDSKGKKER